MSRIYDKTELQNFLDLYSAEETREEAINQVNSFLTDFVNEEADVEQDNLELLNHIIETFGTYTDDEGNQKFTELGAKAMARYQSVKDSLENATNLADEERIYQLTSDQNQIKFDLLTLNIYREMGLIDESVNPANMTPAQVTETINSVNLTRKQQTEYSNRFVDNVIGNPELFELLPPKVLTDAYIFTKEQWKKIPDDENVRNRFETLARRIDYLIENFAKKADYFYADPSNIADLYAGYRKMCEVRSKDLKEAESDNKRTREYKQAVNNSINDTMARLEEIVAVYSDMWNLKNLKPEDADKLDERWREISESLKDVELNDDVLARLSGYKFLDESGNPLPQFIDEHGEPQLEFRPGYKLNPDGRLNRIISLAKTDVAMRNVGDLEREIKDIDLASGLSDRIPWKMAEISIPDQVISGIETVPHQMLNQEDVDRFWENLEKEGGSITDSGYIAALDAQVNQAAGFAGMMAEKVGADKAIVMRPFEAIEDIDKLAKTRSEKIAAGEHKQKINFFKRIVKNFGAAAVMSAGLTFIGKATGVAYAGAAIGTTLGVGNMVVQGFKWRKEQQKAGKPYGLKEFFSDKRNWGPAMASGLGIAAAISMATGNPELAAGFGIGAMAAGGGSSAAMIYKDALNAGYTRGQAIAGAIAVAGATIAGGFAGRAAMDLAINYVNNNTDSNLFKTEHQITTGHETTNRVYADGVIEHNEKILNMWEQPQSLNARIDGLMNAGLSHDDAVRYLLAWHDATDHNLGPGYFKHIGMDADALATFRGSISGTDVNLTPESIAAFEHFNPHISATNTVGYINGAPVDYRLPANAMYDSNGVLVPGHDVYSTYVNHDMNVFSDVPVITNEVDSVFTPNELAYPAGIGALGVYEPRVVPTGFMDRMRERIGALADRAKKVLRRENEGSENEGDQDIVPDAPIAPVVPDNPEDVPVVPDNPEDVPVVPDDPENVPAVIDGPGDINIPVIEGPDTTERPSNPDAPEEPTDNGDKEKSGRGFFGTCKDITYKIMQTIYHGVKKTVIGLHEINKQIIQNTQDSIKQIQQGVNEMKMERLQNEQAIDAKKQEHANKKALAAIDAAKEREKALEGRTADDINRTNLATGATLAGENLKLLQKLGEKSLKLEAELQSDLRKLEHEHSKQAMEQKHEIEMRLANIKAWKKEAEAFRAMGGKDAAKEIAIMKKLENKLKAIEAQGEVDVDIVRARGKNKVRGIKADGRTSRAGKFTQAISRFFKGFGDVTADDITSADNAAKLAQKKFKKAKTESAKMVWKKAMEELAEIMRDYEYSEEDKEKYAKKVIKDAMEQIEATR